MKRATPIQRARDRTRPAAPERRPGAGAIHRGAARVLDILEFLAESRDGFTLATLSRRLRVPKSSLLALLRTFTERGYLAQQPGGVYELGPRAVEMGLSSRLRRELPALAAPVLQGLAARSGESVFLGVFVPSAREIVYVDKVESPHRLRYTAELGERRPLHCTAPGLAVLAFLPDPEREALVASLDLQPFTEFTITDRGRLRARLDEVRRDGVAVSLEEFMLGAVSVAAPIVDRHGMPVAPLSVMGPAPRMLAQREGLSGAVKAGAATSHHQRRILPARPIITAKPRQTKTNSEPSETIRS